MPAGYPIYILLTDKMFMPTALDPRMTYAIF